MYRLEEMKAWQKEQQSKLLNAQQKQEENFLKAQKEQILKYLSQNELDYVRKDDSDSIDLEQFMDSRLGDNVASPNPANDYETEESRKKRIQYLEALLDECYHKKALLEEMPLSSSYQDFSKHLEMSLLQDKESDPEEQREDGQEEEEIERMVEKPKRPFLRKGEGLARFRMTADDFKQPVKMSYYRSRSHSALKSNDGKSSAANQRSRTCQLAQPKSKFTSAKPDFKTVAPPLKSSRTVSTFGVSQTSQKLNLPVSILKKPSPSETSSAFSQLGNTVAHHDSDQKEKNEQRELREFEILEEKVGNNDVTEVEASEDDAWTDFSSSEEESEKDRNDARENLISNFVKESNPRTSEVNKTEPKSSGARISPSGKTDFKNELLQQRLEDLEKEIEIFRKENAKLAKSKQEFELERSNFWKQKREFEAKMKKFREEDEAQLAEERKKLQKEKLVFERYTKEVRSKPNKQEREEIKLLRNEIDELKKELERREGKWGSSQARIRNQMKEMEKDNSNLREQVVNLQKESSQIQLISKGIKLTDNMSNTNIIHAINRQLSQLTPEDIEELLSKREQILKKPNIINKAGAAKTNAKQPSSKEKVPISKPALKKSSENSVKQQKKVQINIKNSRNINRCYSSSESEDSDIIIDAVNKPVLAAIYPKDDDIVLKQYEDEFFTFNAPLNSRLNANETETNTKGDIIECISVDGNREKIFPDGRREIWFPNGNAKKISADGNLVKIIYYNGDVKETIVSENIVKYYYAESKTWHTTFKDGLEILEFSNGQVERRLTNGVVEISFPNGCGRRVFPDGREEWTFSDKSVLKTDQKNGLRVLELPNGQKEYHTAEYKKREFPDGTVKLVYPDGTQETRYANGRVRLKDKNGKLIMDSDVK